MSDAIDDFVKQEQEIKLRQDHEYMSHRPDGRSRESHGQMVTDMMDAQKGGFFGKVNGKDAVGSAFLPPAGDLLKTLTQANHEQKKK